MDRSILNLSSIKEWLKLDVVSSFIFLTGNMLRRNVLLKRPVQPVIVQKCFVEADYLYF